MVAMKRQPESIEEDQLLPRTAHQHSRRAAIHRSQDLRRFYIIQEQTRQCHRFDERLSAWRARLRACSACPLGVHAVAWLLRTDRVLTVPSRCGAGTGARASIILI
jgi:hypothetical protein